MLQSDYTSHIHQEAGAILKTFVVQRMQRLEQSLQPVICLLSEASRSIFLRER